MKRLVFVFPIIIGLIGCSRTAQPNAADISNIESGLLLPIALKGQDNPHFKIADRMQEYRVPGASIAIVKNGQIAWSKAYGLADTETNLQIDTATLFQAGSVSKPVAALAALKLVEEGKLDLDEDVNTYLQSWKVAGNVFTDSSKVTLRRLLSHTAGLTVHGFPGYTNSETMPSTLEVITGQGNTDSILVFQTPGSNWKYSGGGYTIMQLMVEEITGEAFDVYMDREILPALGMTKSTYSQPVNKDKEAHASAAYTWEGKMIDGRWNNYPEKAAAGLWTTPNDLARYAIKIQGILNGDTSGPISQEMAKTMVTAQLNNWGLGPSLSGEGDSLTFQHGGKNAGFTNVFAATAYQGTGVVIMTNADKGGQLMGEVMRSICAEYDWPFMRQTEVEPVAMPPNKLEAFAGTYLWDPKGETSNYFIELVVEDGGLVVVDTNNNERDLMLPLDSMGFIQTQTGDQMRFESEATPLAFNWNGQFRFFKVK